MDATTKLLHKNWDYLHSNYDEEDLQYLLDNTGKDSFIDQINWNHTIIVKINEGSAAIHKQIVDDGDVPPRRVLYLNNAVLTILTTTGYYNDNDKTYCDKYDVVIDGDIVGDTIYITGNQYYVELDILNG